jgi:hypothetical protein
MAKPILTKPILILQLRSEDITSDEFVLRIDTFANHGCFELHTADVLKREVSRKPTPYAQAVLSRFVQRYSGN